MLDKVFFTGSLNAPLSQQESEGKLQKPKIWGARDPKKVLSAKNGHLPILGGLTKSRTSTFTGLVNARDFIQSLVQSKVICQIRDFYTKLVLLKRNICSEKVN